MRRILFGIAVMLTIPTASFSDDSWLYCVTNPDGDIYYLNMLSVSRKIEIYRFWVKCSVSQEGQEYRASIAKSEDEKKRLLRLKEILQLVEVDFMKNSIRVVEEFHYDEKGHMIWKDSNIYGGWSDIVPSSIGELLRDTAFIVERLNAGHLPRQPFTLPNAPDMTRRQRQTWEELQKYLEQIVYRSDFKAFYVWHIKQVNAAEITLKDVSDYLYEIAMNNGGNFLTVIEVIEGWYQTFRREYSRK